MVGFYSALFRLWCAIRADRWRAWEDTHGAAPFFAASRGNSVVDVAWRQAVKAELAIATGQKVAVVAQDLKKCYEYVRFHILSSCAIRQKPPSDY